MGFGQANATLFEYSCKSTGKGALKKGHPEGMTSSSGVASAQAGERG